MSLADLKRLLFKKEQIIVKLNDIEEFTKHFVVSTDSREIKNRISEMHTIREEFENINIDIMCCQDTAESEASKASKTDLSEVTRFSKSWHVVLSSLQNLLEQNSPNVTNNAVHNNAVQSAKPQFNVKLPEINLPTFSGKHTEWLPFFDVFQNLIHNNQSLDDCQKFHYLKSCLKGDAVRAVESLPISSSNYQTAWSVLQKRYKNTRLIIQAHVQAILNSPEINKSTSESLEKLLGDITNNLEALKVINVPVESWDAILTTIIIGKLDYQTRREFENTLGSDPLQLEQLTSFLDKKRIVLESLNQNTKPKIPEKQTSFKPNPNSKRTQHSYASNATTTKFPCYFCKGSHHINHCENFLRLNVNQRRTEVNKRKLCLNCFRSNHRLSECRASGCQICQSRLHHTLIHDNLPPEGEQRSNSSTNHCLSLSKTHIVLSTATVLVSDVSGKEYKCRALLDVGSQVNILSERICNLLNLKRKIENMSISGVNDTCNNAISTAKLVFKSLYRDYEASIDCCILEKVTTNLPTESFDKRLLNIPVNVQLADPEFNQNGSIDLLLGAETFWTLLSNDRIKLSAPNLYLSRTLLGWVVGGSFTENRKSLVSCNVIVQRKRTNDLNELLERFWEQENVTPTQNNWSSEEIECEEHFLNTYQRDNHTGRFIVKLPFKNNKINIGNSSQNAAKRFISLERRFRKDSNFKETYCNEIANLINNGYLKEVAITEDIDTGDNFYLPHSGVFKRDSENPKIRIVYDGSAKSSNGVSLNENLLTGPNLQNDAFGILVRFRTYQVIISCDMEKMFLQIKIDSEDTKFQRIYWRFNENEPLKVYQLTRLVFGLTNSPYTAMRCVNQLVTEVENEFPSASRALKNDRFMDDILTGSENICEGVKLRDQLVEILGRGGFKLSKWNSNIPKIIPNSSIPSERKVVELNKENVAKVLGLWWDPSNDILSYRVQTNLAKTNAWTKRSILSAIAKIYDPIGIISPILIRAKILMQELWTLKLEWDDPVPQNITDEWTTFISDLEFLREIKIPRKIIWKTGAETDLVMFADASLRAYGAAVYVRVRTGEGTFAVNLICSKSRVSPLKVLSLPRLELCAAWLGAELMDTVSREINLNIKNKYYFTDSMIVLHYLNSNANSWQVFVANRVSKIQTLSDIGAWYHVESKENPADIISRGASPQQINSTLYWNGPKFLAKEVPSWPENRFRPSIKLNSLPEKRKTALVATVTSQLHLINKYSSFSKLQRVFAYCFRFVKNLRKQKSEPYLTTQELVIAHNIIISIVQQNEFAEEWLALKNQQPVPKTSKLYTLDPFVDNKGLIRLGGRLRNSSLSFDQKFPILLPANCHITELLIRKEHLSLLHAGATQTLASLRTKYWPLRARNLVRRVIHKCIVCFRVSPPLATQKMGDLPTDRVMPCRPFIKVGLDYFGPIYIKQGGKRSTKMVKGWVALFVCLVTRAVHLEVVSDLTAECFLNALNRFCSRRGKVSHIYCDNATTFVGAKRQLDEIFNFFSNKETQDRLRYLTQENIIWKFIPPRSPNFGGLWERLVRSTKFHVKRVTMNANLTFEEAVTLMSQIESIINSRPLTPLSNDPSDLQALTPAHFLIGESLTALPEHVVIEVPEARLRRWERIRKIKQHFWKRWSQEVVSQLQSRPKWCQPVPNMKVGSLVLVVDENAPPMVWKLGRVEEVFPGPDGLVRVARVRTNQGIYTRSVRKLAVLPNDDDADA